MHTLFPWMTSSRSTCLCLCVDISENQTYSHSYSMQTPSPSGANTTHFRGTDLARDKSTQGGHGDGTTDSQRNSSKENSEDCMTRSRGGSTNGSPVVDATIGRGGRGMTGNRGGRGGQGDGTTDGQRKGTTVNSGDCTTEDRGDTTTLSQVRGGAIRGRGERDMTSSHGGYAKNPPRSS